MSSNFDLWQALGTTLPKPVQIFFDNSDVNACKIRKKLYQQMLEKNYDGDYAPNFDPQFFDFSHWRLFIQTPFNIQGGHSLNTLIEQQFTDLDKKINQLPTTNEKQRYLQQQLQQLSQAFKIIILQQLLAAYFNETKTVNALLDPAFIAESAAYQLATNDLMQVLNDLAALNADPENNQLKTQLKQSLQQVIKQAQPLLYPNNGHAFIKRAQHYAWTTLKIIALIALPVALFATAGALTGSLCAYAAGVIGTKAFICTITGAKAGAAAGLAKGLSSAWDNGFDSPSSDLIKRHAKEQVTNVLVDVLNHLVPNVAYSDSFKQ